MRFADALFILILSAFLAALILWVIPAEGQESSTSFFSPAGPQIQDEGTPLTPLRGVLNFTGAGVSCVDNSGNARVDCTITIPSHNRSEYFSAWAVNADGTNCADPAGVTIGSGPIVGAVACADNDASTIYFNLQMPDNYDGGTITIGVQAVATSATPSGDLDADVSAFCENDSGAIGSDWGTEIALDVTFNTQNDLEMAESAAVTPTATCQAGSHLFARYQVDAAGTDGTITSQILGFSVGYNVAADDLDEVD